MWIRHDLMQIHIQLFFLIADRIHVFGYGSRVLMTKNVNKFTGGNFFILIFISKIARRRNDAQATGEAFSPQKSSIHPALQNINIISFFYFCGSFLPSSN
jgi:hypothetical protein